MKKQTRQLVLSLVTLLSVTTACGSDKNEVDNPSGPVKATVNVAPENLNPDYSAQTLDLTVTANVDWSIRSDVSWITLKPAGGVKNEPTSVKVTLEANKEFDTRSAVLSIVSGASTIKTIEVKQGYVQSAKSSVSSMILGGEATEREITITANGDWTLTTEAEWLSIKPASGSKGETKVEISAGVNSGETTRETLVTLNCGDTSSTISVSQLNYNLTAPDGYTLVWHDEFDYEGRPSSDWVHENWNAGHVNNELQTYTGKAVDGKYTTEVKDGFLHINCFKGSDGKIYSGRMNALPNTGWLYGYVEARINLPSGKGTWPAFWMMPSNVDWNTNGWPHCGEIDIMEEVGVDANRVSSSLHTGKYNHTLGTQKTHEMYLAGAEGEFHTYALEWTEDAITTYVDGKVQLSVKKSEMGDDHESWPFHYAFYPILNLAWGGDWGGYDGVNESALPITMLVDYVRIFQKQ